ncbi:type I polyketide synthase, partial [Paractinoplanes hotanensis]
QALLATYGQERETPLWLGSVKSNLGHTQAAAGVAGVIKMVQAMRHGVLPKTLHVDAPSSHVDWEAGSVELLTEARDWPGTDKRRAAVSSFGISGTNAHVILEATPFTPAADPADGPIVLSAADGDALQTMLDRRDDYQDPAALTARAQLSHRAVLLPDGHTVRGVATEGRLAIVFTGQGSQRAEMGRGLYQRFPAYAAAYDAVRAELDLPDLDADQTGWAQPAIFAVEVALLELVRAWGLTPDVVAGHSIGEVAAAYAAGVLTLKDAAQLISARARLMQALPSGGAMLAVRAAETDIHTAFPDLDIAAVNGPNAVVVAGTEDQIAAVAKSAWKTTRLRTSHAFHSRLMDPMLDDFRAVVETLTFHEPTMPVQADWTDPGYWVRHVRDTVRWADVQLDADRVLELGPDTVLATLIPDAVAALRRDRDEPTTLLAAVADLWVRGQHVDWAAVLGRSNAGAPTYPFQRRRFWPRARTGAGGDVTGLGLTGTSHPILAASAEVPGAGLVLHTGSISAATHPWISDHRVHGRVVVPGAALAEMAATASDSAVDELLLHAPLVVPDGETVQLRLTVDTGRGAVAIHSRQGEAWTEHATGTLTGEEGTATAVTVPAGAEELDLAGFYPAMAAAGLDYGPAFQGLRRAWRDGDNVYADVEVPDPPAGFALHPALFDAALHAIAAGGLLTGDTIQLPFAFEGVRLLSPGATSLLVRLTANGPSGVRLTAADDTGLPVASVDRIALRPVAAETTNLHTVEWTPTSVDGAEAVGWHLLPLGQPLPQPAPVLLLDATDPTTVREALADTLSTLQAFVADPAWSDAHLVVLTSGAVAAGPHDAVDGLPHAALWGLVRSAQTENPGRFTLIDADRSDSGHALVPGVVEAGLPQAAIRDGKLLVPRLVPARPGEPAGFGDGTVVVTGATGALGSELARHLVETHGVKNLLLISRRGAEAPGAAELLRSLAGVEARLEACDLADADAVRRLLEPLPVSAVIHAAGITDDAMLTSLTVDRFEAVLRAKVDAAVNLAAATTDKPLAAFVLFSSVAGVLGNAGQGNYAAANTFLDAYAARLRHQGIPATSLAWGLWEAGMGGALTDADRDRLRLGGVEPLATRTALDLFDAALTTGAALVVPAILGPARRGPVKKKTNGREQALSRQLSALTAPEQTRTLLGLIRAHIAAVLGDLGLDGIGDTRAFGELGFDSLTAVEFRNRLAADVGRRLAPTLIFDHPTPLALAEALREQLAPAAATEDAALLAELARLEAAGAPSEAARTSAVLRLRALLADWTAPAAETTAGDHDIADADDDELFSLLDNELGPT